MNQRMFFGFFAIAAHVTLLLPILAHEGYQAENPNTARQQKIKQLNGNLQKIAGSGPLDQGLFTKGPGSNVGKGDIISTWAPAVELNDIDQVTFKKMREDAVPINGLCSDSVFLRRVSLILTGRLPDPDLTRSFLGDNHPEKRSNLVETLMASESFNTHWAFWFQEYFRSNGFMLRAGLLPYNQYFAEMVQTNKSLDQMTRDLMTTFGLSDQVAEANFYVRANQMSRQEVDFWDNAAVEASSKFLGVPLECISCHDGAYHLEEVNLYLAEKKRSDFWAMSAFFAGVTRRPGLRDENQILSLNITERPTDGYLAESNSGDRPIRDGGLITPQYLFSGQLPIAEKTFAQSIADIIVADRQFARNWANRLWGHVFGLAMVEPMDSFDLKRIDPEAELPEGWTHQALDLNLLEHMTDKMIEFNFDLRAYFRYVLNSATFQMSSEFLPGNWEEQYAPYYTRYLARHMTSEMVYDSITVATGVTTQMNMRSRGSDAVLTANFAHELPDNNQPRGNRYSDIFQFLQGFGRGNRTDLPRSNDGNIGQALLLMNSPVIHDRLIHPTSRLAGYLNQGLSGERIVEELYLDLFMRTPTAAETQAFLTEISQIEDPRDQLSSVLWLLMNRVEFTYIY